MTQASPTNEPTCGRCGAAVPAEASICWLCYAPLRAAETPEDAELFALAAELGRPATRFSLAALMIFVTGACVVLGVWTLWPGLGIVLGVVLLITWLAAALRTLSHGTRAAVAGSLLSSTTLMLLIFLVGGAVAAMSVATVVVTIYTALAEVCGTFPGM